MDFIRDIVLVVIGVAAALASNLALTKWKTKVQSREKQRLAEKNAMQDKLVAYERLINILDIVAARPQYPYFLEERDVVDKCFEDSGYHMSSSLKDQYAKLLGTIRGFDNDTWRPILIEMHKLAKSEHATLKTQYDLM